MVYREKIYISSPLFDDNIYVKDANIERIKRIYYALSITGYNPEVPPGILCSLDSDTQRELSFQKIICSSRVFAIPASNGFIPVSMWNEIIYARQMSVPILQFGNEMKFNQWLNSKIITLTGASGSGKSSIAKGVLERYPDKFKLLTSVTTRPPRDTDLPGEYRYVSKEEFVRMQEDGDLLWPSPGESLPIHGNMYGTAKVDVDEAIKAPHKSIMLLVPSVLDILYKYTRGRIWSFYIVSPREDILMSRLLGRGDRIEDARQRIKECRQWDFDARKSASRYTFINNNNSLKSTIRDILLYLR